MRERGEFVIAGSLSEKIIKCLIAFFVFLTMAASLGIAAKAEAGRIVDTSDALYTYDEMTEDIALLTKNYPGKCSCEIIGHSVDGRNIYAVTVGNTNAPGSIFVESGTHAREYINCMLTMYQIEEYLKHWNDEYAAGSTYGQILSRCNLVFVPMTNPDGVTFSQFGLDSIQTPKVRQELAKISKGCNIRRWKANARGVDLNRNYDCYFGAVNTKTGPSDADFCGYQADSEPEVQAIEGLIQSKSSWVGAVCFHSAESAVFYNVGDAAKPEVLSRSLEMARLAVSMNKYNLYMDSRGYSQPRGLLYHWLLINRSIPTILIETCKGNSPQEYGEWAKLIRGNGNIPIQMCYFFGMDSALVSAKTNMSCSVWSTPNSKNSANRVKYLPGGRLLDVYRSIITGEDGKEYYRTKKGYYVLAKAVDLME